jgi:hypothetical protein
MLKPRQSFPDPTAEACVQSQYSSYRILCRPNVTDADFFRIPLLITILLMFCAHLLLFRHVIGLPSLHVITVLVLCGDFTVDPALCSHQVMFTFLCPSFHPVCCIISTVHTSYSAGL